jgi:hypothetical protein
MTTESPISLRALRLLEFIGEAETGAIGDAAYRTVIGHHEGELAVPITSLSVDELLALQEEWPARGWLSTAAGKYQIIRTTLIALKQAVPLTGGELFDQPLQDRLGFALLQRCGWDKVVAREISRRDFALAVAKEWAAMPVLKPMRGLSIRLRRGQSYYAGDGRNAALVTARQFERALADALGHGMLQAFLRLVPARRAPPRRMVAL